MPRRVRQDVSRRRFNLGRRARAQIHAADVGFMRNIRRLYLERHRPADLGRDADGVRGVPRQRFTRHGQTRNAENFLAFGLGQKAARGKIDMVATRGAGRHLPTTRLGLAAKRGIVDEMANGL